MMIMLLTDGGGDVTRQHYLVNFDAGELESDPHSPRARGTEVGIKFWPTDEFCQKKLYLEPIMHLPKSSPKASFTRMGKYELY